MMNKRPDIIRPAPDDPDPVRVERVDTLGRQGHLTGLGSTAFKSRINKTRHQGAALAVSLILVVVASMLGISAMNSAHLGERIAGNERQVAEAFMAAETGLSVAMNWLNEPANRNFWSLPENALTTINDSPVRSIDASRQVAWQIMSLAVSRDNSGNDWANIVSRGTVTLDANLSIHREISAAFSRARWVSGLAPINVIGQISAFEAAKSNQFYVVGAEGQAAIATNSQANVDTIVSSIPATRINNYGGADRIRSVEFDTPFDDPQALNDFIQEIRARATPVPRNPCNGCDIGTLERPAISLFEGDRLELRGNTDGHGILVVIGDLYLAGTPKFTGLLIVTGNTFEVDGTGGMRGAVVFANPVQNASTGEWSFGDTTSQFNIDVDGGGRAEFAFDAAALNSARALLEGTAAYDAWTNTDGTPRWQPSKLTNWAQVIN